jgi:DNA-binding CsgD family transcriptional regulator
MLIGRESERRLIEPLLSGVRVGESGVLVLTGEAGIGKSALLDWVADSVTGMTTLRATGIEAEQEVPFGGLLQLLRPILPLIDTLPGPQADALAGALALRSSSSGDRFAVGAGTLGLICRAAEAKPLALLIDDAHLLDRPSAQALAFAGRRLLADQVLLLATVRAGEPCAFVDAGLRTLTVEGLDRQAATELLARRSGSRLSAALLDRFYLATAGNPLALLALSNDPAPWQGLPPDAPIPVPAAIARAVAKQTDQLDPEARTAILVAAASAGEWTVVRRAAGALGSDPAALDRVESAGLIRRSGDQLIFRHPLVRSSVYAGADPADRRAAHRALAGALPTDELERRAWHLAGAAVGSDEAAAALLSTAGARAAARKADAVASSAYERAALLTADDQPRAVRLTAAGESAWLAGLGQRADSLLTEALRLTVDPSLRIRILEAVGALAARGGSLARARDTLLAGGNEVAEFDVDLSVVLLADAISACFYLGDAAAAMAAAHRVEELLPLLETDRARILGLMAAGTARVLNGRGGMAQMRAAVELLDTTDQLVADPRRAGRVVLGPLFLRESDTGRLLVQRAVDESRRQIALGVLPNLLFHLARDDATTDRWPTAASEYHEAIRLARETDQVTELAVSLAGLGWLEARQGQRVDCLAHLTESVRLCDEGQIQLFRAWCHAGLGDLDLGTGMVEQALGHFAAMAEHLARHGIRDVDLSPDPERVELLLRLGRLAQARSLAESYSERAAAKGQPWALARAQRSLAATGAADDLDSSFAAALALHDHTLDVFEKAKTLLAQGVRLRRERRRTEARLPLRAAFDEFDRIGAAPFADLAAAELRASGERARIRTASAALELTPQELQIATLLAGGRSTRQTAAALFLSPKTVEYHLRHVYTKLDVHSRDELAVRLSR